MAKINNRFFLGPMRSGKTLDFIGHYMQKNFGGKVSVVIGPKANTRDKCVSTRFNSSVELDTKLNHNYFNLFEKAVIHRQEFEMHKAIHKIPIDLKVDNQDPNFISNVFEYIASIPEDIENIYLNEAHFFRNNDQPFENQTILSDAIYQANLNGLSVILDGLLEDYRGITMPAVEKCLTRIPGKIIKKEASCMFPERFFVRDNQIHVQYCLDDAQNTQLYQENMPDNYHGNNLRVEDPDKQTYIPVCRKHHIVPGNTSYEFLQRQAWFEKVYLPEMKKLAKDLESKLV